ncbi:respiratory nitrate reductase subunit gamma [Fodinisporobacter ferrooxydans]|uniref:Respiratory nitrate reductase subunit gamma n=1 Tax=Fodinisporobacter ferrooxydans TaxID=2901836 RepID=A0ABY4CQZ1_9BACL|nr:respiratory nitrate reductase subunit gamma [Alicyclobacillaceae bacterium MYW30-H2]
MWQQFLWVVYPYVMTTIFIVGHIYRYNTDQLSWTAKSSEFLEKKQLRIGSLMFHFGILAVFFGHVVGLLVPKSLLTNMGISEAAYHQGAIYGGGLVGIVAFAGILLLFIRRTSNARVRATSSTGDVVVVVLLCIIMGMGLYNTIGFNLFVGGFDYRETIAPWFRGLLTFTPDAAYMIHVPLFYQLHVIFSFALFGIWPFTRLVHVWSVPVSYFRRSFIVYRRRNAVHNSRI